MSLKIEFVSHLNLRYLYWENTSPNVIISNPDNEHSTLFSEISQIDIFPYGQSLLRISRHYDRQPNVPSSMLK